MSHTELDTDPVVLGEAIVRPAPVQTSLQPADIPDKQAYADDAFLDTMAVGRFPERISVPEAKLYCKLEQEGRLCKVEHSVHICTI